MSKEKFPHLYQKLLANIKVSNNRCWIWQAGRFGRNKEYGYVYWLNKFKCLKAHIASYKTFIGDIPLGYDVHHKCRNTLCINPIHLELLLHADHTSLHKRSTCPSRSTLYRNEKGLAKKYEGPKI